MASTRIEPISPNGKKLLVILPGILGNPDIDYINIKPHLSREYNVARWSDPRNNPKDIEKLLKDKVRKKQFSTFESLAKLIVDGILTKSPQNEPILLLGYSFGGMLLSEMINLLKGKGRIVYAYCIDTAPPITANNYFTSRKIDATKDLIAICDTIARELHASKLPEEYSDEAINSLRIQSITKQLTSIALDYKDADESILSTFHHRVGIVEQNLRVLLKYNPTHYLQPDAFHVGMTTETLRKYATPADGGWGTYWKNLNNLSSTLLPGTHRTLLSSEHAPAVAADIIGFFTNAFKLQAQVTASPKHAISAPITVPAPVPSVDDKPAKSPPFSILRFFSIPKESQSDFKEKNRSDRKSPDIIELKENQPFESSFTRTGDNSLSPVPRLIFSFNNPLGKSDGKTDGKMTDRKTSLSSSRH